MLLEDVWPFIEKSKNQIALMRAFKFPLTFYNKETPYTDFFTAHTAIKVLSNDINASLYVLMCSQLIELNNGIAQLSTISEKTYKDTDNHQLNGVQELQAQFILLNHFWENGSKLFASFLEYAGGEAETELLKHEIAKYRAEEQKLYAVLKDYEPFKIHDLNKYFIDMGKTIKHEKEEFNIYIKNYSSIVKAMRCFSTFTNLLPSAIRMPSSKNYLAMVLSERMSLNSITYLNDEKLMEYFLPEVNDFVALNIEKEVKVSKFYQFADKFTEFKNNYPHLFNTLANRMFLERNNGVKNSMEYLYCSDIKEEDFVIVEKQLEYLQNNIYEKDFTKLKAKPKDYIILDKISLQNWESKVDKSNLETSPLAKYMSLVNAASIVSNMYEMYINKQNDNDNEKSDNKVKFDDNITRNRRGFIEKELKTIQRTLMFGNNVKYMKDLFSMRENGELLNKKLQIFYFMRKSIDEAQKENINQFTSLNKIRCITKGMEFALTDMKSILDEDLRFLKLKSMTSNKKTVNKSKKKI
jgi:hypothetical protein